MNPTGSPLWPIQKKIYEVLRGDPTLMEKIKGVFDCVRPNEEVPYVQMVEFSSDPWGAYPNFGRIANAQISVWSRYRGMKSADFIADDVIRLLARQDLPLEYPWSNDSSLLAQDSVGTQPDGITRVYTMNFKFFVLMDEYYVPPQPEE